MATVRDSVKNRIPMQAAIFFNSGLVPIVSPFSDSPLIIFRLSNKKAESPSKATRLSHNAVCGVRPYETRGFPSLLRSKFSFSLIGCGKIVVNWSAKTMHITRIIFVDPQ
jgi:hypothetical protein